MIDHFGINCVDYPRSQQFYDRVLGVLGYSRQVDFGEAIGYGRDGKPAFWIAEGAGMGPNREVHLAFAAADHDAVRGISRRRGRVGRRVAARAAALAGISPRLLWRLRP